MRGLLTAGLLALALAPASAAESRPSGYAHPELLVETAWLDENIIRPDILVVDLRARELFDQGHIPGSYSLDDNRLVKREGTVPSVIPADELKELVETIGIGDAVHVIALDDTGGRAAARLWWTLGYYGFDNVSILNGGYARWAAEGRAITGDYAFHRAAVFTPRARPERAASADAVRDWKKGRPSGLIVDARSPGEFEGKIFKTKRSGHIPGAVNLPWDGALKVQDDFKLFKPATDLLDLLGKAGITRESQVVAYCLDGRRATHLLFTMALVGIGGANYVGSWAEWNARQDLPVEAPNKTPDSARAPAPPARPGTKAPAPNPAPKKP